MRQRLLILISMWLMALGISAQNVETTDSLISVMTQQLDQVTVSTRRTGVSRMSGALNGVNINREELFKAACCNLGESFVTNPSVDVSYNDAATGAKQIKLLGLSGTYVQMLTENLPAFRGAAIPFALGYVPGTWMKSIQVSKGNSSVKNGYEAMTGQINIEYLKPDEEQGVTVNLYGNTKSRTEANAEANVHLTDELSTELLAHYENDWGHHDDNNDGFLDQPKVEQYNVQNRWKWTSGNYMLHAGINLIHEEREGGQTTHHQQVMPMDASPLYKIGINTNRYELYMKHAVILNAEHGTNVALMYNGSLHNADASYGLKEYGIRQQMGYAQLMLETNFTDLHSISAGLSLNYDRLKQHIDRVPGYAPQAWKEQETTTGAYLQYTLNLNSQLIAMAGMRLDHSNVYGSFFTPRIHIKFAPSDIISLRLSAGKGYRSPHAWAELNNLLSSGRQLLVDDLKQEEAWNYGVSAALNIPLGNQTLKLNAEYYYTDFNQQMVVDYDTDHRSIIIGNLDGKSYSHTLQVDASYQLLKGLTLTAAYRFNDVKTTFNGQLMEKPLTNRYKGLISASYKTPLGLWQLDATLQLNGGGRMPTPYQKADGNSSWDERFHGYEQLSAQITRWFRHFSIYIGGENLTGFRQKMPIFGADNPWGADFEPTLVWGPVHGAMAYLGVRINIGKL